MLRSVLLAVAAIVHCNFHYAGTNQLTDEEWSNARSCFPVQHAFHIYDQQPQWGAFAQTCQDRNESSYITYWTFRDPYRGIPRTVKQDVLFFNRTGCNNNELLFVIHFAWNAEYTSPDYLHWTFVGVDVSFCMYSTVILDTLPFSSNLMLHKVYSVVDLEQWIIEQTPWLASLASLVNRKSTQFVRFSRCSLSSSCSSVLSSFAPPLPELPLFGPLTDQFAELWRPNPFLPTLHRVLRFHRVDECDLPHPLMSIRICDEPPASLPLFLLSLLLLLLVIDLTLFLSLRKPYL